MRPRQKQKGAAALMFILVLVPMLGFFTIGTDGALMMQNDARLNDALEAASLAVSAANDPNDDDDGVDDGKFGIGSNFNQTLTKAYISEYMHKDLNSISSVKIAKLDCEDIPECVTGIENGEPRFFEFQVTATTNHDVVFGTEYSNVEKYEVTSNGRSRKYQNHAIDIAFVSDFSGSMRENWAGPKRKYKDLIDVIESVTDELEKFNSLQNVDDNTVAFIGFNSKVKSLHSRYNIRRELPIFEGTRTVSEVALCQKSYLTRSGGGISYTQTVSNLFTKTPNCNSKSYVHPGDYETYNINTYYGQRKVYNKFLPDKSSSYYNSNRAYCYRKNSSGDARRSTEYRCQYNPIRNNYDESYFYEQALTTDFSALNTTIKSFYPEYGTASYEGLIRGAQIIKEGDNPRRLIIILSDGFDNSTNITSGLVNAGMCSTIINELEKNPTTNGDDVTAKIALIGFDYDVSSNAALKRCVGDKNVFKADNKDEILNTILELISEEIGHLK